MKRIVQATGVSAIAMACAWGLGFIGNPTLVCLAFAAGPDESEEVQTPSSSVCPSEETAIVPKDVYRAQMNNDLREITLREATLFHQRVVRTFRRELPQNLEFRYWGPLSRDIARQKLVVHQDEVPFALFWSVQDALVVFSFWISTARTEDTVAVSTIEGRKLYVNVYSINKDQSPDEMLKALGGRTVRDTLMLLQEEPGLENNEIWFRQRGRKPPGRSDQGEEHPNDSSGFFGDGRTSTLPSGDSSKFEELIELIQKENARKAER